MVEDKKYKYLFYEHMRRCNLEESTTKSGYKCMNGKELACKYKEYVDSDEWRVKNMGIHGFAIIGTGSKCNPNADWNIEQVYVLPTSRNVGWMTKVMRTFIYYHTGVYTVRLLKDDAGKILYWKNLFAEFGYEQCNLRELNEDADSQYIYAAFRKSLQ